jgi:hypothetical protein
MNDPQKKEQYSGVRDQEIRAALDQHWAASDANDFETEHRIYREDAVLEYPQSGERTRGRCNIQNQRASQPSKKRFAVRRIIGGGDLWITEFILTYAVLHREHHGVQGRQGCARNTVLCGSIRGSRMALSMGRTDGRIISRRENSLTTPPFAVCSIIVENRD